MASITANSGPKSGGAWARKAQSARNDVQHAPRPHLKDSLERSGIRIKRKLLPFFACIAVLAAVATFLTFFLKTKVPPSSAPPPPSASPRSTTPTGDTSRNAPPAESGSSASTAAGDVQKASSVPRMYTYEIVRKMPHDARAFTQGLEYELYNGRDVFWESTGLYKQSQMREVNVDDGSVIRAIDLPPDSFGEGVTRTSSGGLIQLTWRSGVTFEYPTVDTFHTGNFTLAAAAAASTKDGCSGPNASCDDALAQGVIQRHTGLSDGWGIAADGAGTLIVTDSSDTMYWFDEVTLQEKKRKVVKVESAPLPWVNELEWIEGEVWGNVWQTPCIARIDPDSAEVTGWILLEGLKEITAPINKKQGLSIDVLNGIAYDTEKRRIFVTGKKWSQMFEIKVLEIPDDQQKAQLQRARTVCKPPVIHL